MYNWISMMKKTNTAILLISSLFSELAFANISTLSFHGFIFNTTCNFIGEQDGIQSNIIDLGTYTVAEVMNNKTNFIDFLLVGYNKDGTSCDFLTSEYVDISWAPTASGWTSIGLQNTGTAKGTGIKLMDKDKKQFNYFNQSVTYTISDNLNTKLPFKAQLVKSSISSDVIAGTVISSAGFAIAYK